MNKAMMARISIMNLLFFATIGSWYLPLGTYMSLGLGFPDAIGVAYSLQGFAVIISVLLIGGAADRYISADKLMIVLALASGVTLWLLSDVGHSKVLFLATLMVHLIFFMPMLPLSATIAFGALADGPRQFPITRLFGSVGFLGTGFVVGSIEGSARTALPLKMGAVVAIALSLYSLTLPYTPAKATNEPLSLKRLFGFDLFSEVKDKSFWTFITATFVMFLPLSFYYAYSNVYFEQIGLKVTVMGHLFGPTAIQMLGQATELLFLLLLPAILARLGIKAVILTGVAAWVARFIMFAFGVTSSGPVTSVLLIGIALHGVCQDFFAVACVIFIDSCFDAALRGRAQCFLAFVMTGLGPLVGANLAGLIFALGKGTEATPDWKFIWLVPAALAACIFVAFAVVFRTPPLEPSTSSAGELP